MNTLKVKPVLLFSTLIIYNYLFWMQNIGVNLPVFSMIMLLANFCFYPGSLKSRQAIITTIGTVFTGAMVVWHNTSMSICMHTISFFIAIGFIHAPYLRTIPFGIWQTLQSYLYVPQTFVEGLKQSEGHHKKLSLLVQFTKRIIIPLAIFIVFYVIYSNANMVFAKFSNIFWNQLFTWISLLFVDFSFLHFVFLLFGLIIITACIYRKNLLNVFVSEQSKSDKLLRIKKGKSHNTQFYSKYILGLKSEYRTAPGY